MNSRIPLTIHLRWELILLVALLAVTGVAARDVELFEGGRLLWSIAYLGLLASALAFSLRMRTPNLAVVGAAILSMVAYGMLAFNLHAPPVVAALVAVLVAGTFGIALALAAELLSVPAWAVTLAGMLVPALVVAGLEPGNPSEPAGAGAGLAWLLAFVVISVGGGGWFATPEVRGRLAPEPPAGGADAGPADGPEPLESWLRLQTGITGSCLIAGVAGIVAVLATGDLFPPAEFGTFPMFNAADFYVVLGAVLLGGVSLSGDRGGVAGTALAVALLAVVLAWFGLGSADAQLVYLVIGLAILAGFALPRVMAAVAVPAEDTMAADLVEDIDDVEEEERT